jgi:cellulose synthase/poly-beta-1,6-N-acetylglucosamine synthase-like glycosyltransferase
MIKNSIITLIQTGVFVLIIYVFLATLYLSFLAISKIFVKGPVLKYEEKKNTFCIIIPAHNEELFIERICQNLLELEYPKQLYDIKVVADNCNDGTIEKCKFYIDDVLVRIDNVNQGKGYAIDFGLRNINLDKYDSVLIVDADSVVDKKLLKELNMFINNGSNIIQCCNAILNRNESWFTELLYVSRLIVNTFYHDSKYRLGLSSYLMGNGMCFSSDLLKKLNWDAFSIGEDWEFYANLIEMDIKVDFAINAKVFHQESKSLKQATSQRLRWSKGRFAVLKNIGIKMLVDGLRTFNFFKIDGALPLIFPNYSLLVNLNLLAIILNYTFFYENVENFNNVILFYALASQVLLFCLGAYLSGRWIKVFIAMLCAPLFLIWKLAIDICTFTGIYKGKKWVRTSRE